MDKPIRKTYGGEPALSTRFPPKGGREGGKEQADCTEPPMRSRKRHRKRTRCPSHTLHQIAVREFVQGGDRLRYYLAQMKRMAYLKQACEGQWVFGGADLLTYHHKPPFVGETNGGKLGGAKPEVLRRLRRNRGERATEHTHPLHVYENRGALAPNRRAGMPAARSATGTRQDAANAGIAARLCGIQGRAIRNFRRKGNYAQQFLAWNCMKLLRQNGTRSLFPPKGIDPTYSRQLNRSGLTVAMPILPRGLLQS